MNEVVADCVELESELERVVDELNETVRLGADLPVVQKKFFGSLGRLTVALGPNWLGKLSPHWVAQVRRAIVQAEFQTAWNRKTLRLLVQHAMTCNAKMFQMDTSIEEATQVLIEYRISGAPVVDEEKRLVGLLSERDLLAVYGKKGAEVHSVGDVMKSGNLVTVQENELLTVAAQLFCNHGYRRLPVLNKEGEVVGIIARRDVLRLIEAFELTEDGNLI